MIKQNSVCNMSIEMSDAFAFPMCDRLCSYVNWIEHAPHSIWDCYFVIKYIDSGIKTHARKIVCHWFFNIIKYFDTAIGYYIRCWKCQSGKLWKFKKSFNSHGAKFGLQYLLFIYVYWFCTVPVPVMISIQCNQPDLLGTSIQLWQMLFQTTLFLASWHDYVS